MNLGLPSINVKLPTPDLRELPGADNPMKLVFDLVTGHKTVRSMALQAGYQAINEITNGQLSRGAQALLTEQEEARHEFEQDWLPNREYALIVIQGAPGEGKTTCAFDLMDRYFEPSGREMLAIGVPQEVLPDGYRELSLSKLRQIGVEIDKASKNDIDPKDVIANYVPRNACILIDDAGIYLAAGSSDKPENRAVRNIIDVRRHLDLVMLLTFQSFFGVDHKFLSADCFIFKQGTPGISGGDRPEIAVWSRTAKEYFLSYNDWHKTHPRPDGEFLDRRGIKDRRILHAFVVAPECGIPFGWNHRRPSWYSERISKNVISTHGKIVDAEFTARDN